MKCFAITKSQIEIPAKCNFSQSQNWAPAKFNTFKLTLLLIRWTFIYWDYVFSVMFLLKKNMIFFSSLHPLHNKSFFLCWYLQLSLKLLLRDILRMVRDRSFSTYAKISEKLTFREYQKRSVAWNGLNNHI